MEIWLKFFMELSTSIIAKIILGIIDKRFCKKES